MPERHPAQYAEPQTWDSVQCLLCPHQCSVAPSRQGLCGVRANRNGVLYALMYGRVAESTPVTIEEAPFFHYLPGSRWLRAGSIGCTMHCPFCNSWRFSQAGGVPTRYVEPAQLAQEAAESGAKGLVFMRNEPGVWHEYVIDVSQEARRRGLRIAVTTSGMWSTEPFAEALEFIDAFLFGFKGFDAEFWSAECGGLLEQSRLNFEMAVTQSRHVEVSYLVIEGRNDAEREVDEFAAWIQEVAPETAVHVLRYEPDFQWDQVASSFESVRRVGERLARSLPYVYAEPDKTVRFRDTRCPGCSAVVVNRSKPQAIEVSGIQGTACSKCGHRLPIFVEADPTGAG